MLLPNENPEHDGGSARLEFTGYGKSVARERDDKRSGVVVLSHGENWQPIPVERPVKALGLTRSGFKRLEDEEYLRRVSKLRVRVEYHFAYVPVDGWRRSTAQQVSLAIPRSTPAHVTNASLSLGDRQDPGRTSLPHKR